MLSENMQAAAATNLDALTTFRPNPRESLHMLGTHFKLIAIPLEGKKFDDLHDVGLVAHGALARHGPGQGHNQDDKTRIEDCARSGEDLTNRDELLGLARTEESCVLKLEAEMEAAG